MELIAKWPAGFKIELKLELLPHIVQVQLTIENLK